MLDNGAATGKLMRQGKALTFYPPQDLHSNPQVVISRHQNRKPAHPMSSVRAKWPSRSAPVHSRARGGSPFLSFQEILTKEWLEYLSPDISPMRLCGLCVSGCTLSICISFSGSVPGTSRCPRNGLLYSNTGRKRT